MANGLLSDWMSGTGVYGSPKSIDPQTGVPYADTRAAQLGALGNIGSLLIAAGQPMTGPQRAQLLGQIGPQISSMQTDIYNAAQRRLMQSQFADQIASREARDKLYQEAQADPAAFEKKFGFSPIGLPADSLLSLTTKMHESNALAKPEREARAAARAGMKAAGTVSPTQALSAGGGPTVEAGTMIGQPSGASRYQQYMAAGDAAFALGTPAGDKIGMEMFDLAEKFKPQDVKLSAGETLYRDGKQFLTGAPKPQELSSDQKNYQSAVEGGYKGSFTDYQTMIARASQPQAESEEMKMRIKGFGEMATDIRKQAAKSGSLQNNLDVMEQINQSGISGALPGAIAKFYPAGTKGAEVFESLVNDTAPQLKQEGSGSQSDADLAGFLKSLPSLLNRPGGNEIIIDVLKSKSKINLDKGDIVAKYTAGDLTFAEAVRQISALDKKGILTDELKNKINKYVGGTTKSIAGGTLTGEGTILEWSPSAGGM
jgi:hypothetical protein